MKDLRGLPCRFWLSACLEHSSDFAERGFWALAPGAAGAAGVADGAAGAAAGAWAKAAPEKASRETRAIDCAIFFISILTFEPERGVMVPLGDMAVGMLAPFPAAVSPEFLQSQAVQITLRRHRSTASMSQGKLTAKSPA